MIANTKTRHIILLNVMEATTPTLSTSIVEIFMILRLNFSCRTEKQFQMGAVLGEQQPVLRHWKTLRLKSCPAENPVDG